jgi:hypothetical protein
MFVFGLLLGSSGDFARHLPKYADGTTVATLRSAASMNAVVGSGIDSTRPCSGWSARS